MPVFRALSKFFPNTLRLLFVPDKIEKNNKKFYIFSEAKNGRKRNDHEYIRNRRGFEISEGERRPQNETVEI